MPPTLADRVLHILEAIEAIERLLEIICEASRHIPDDVKASEPTIPWPTMIDFGNRLRHAYHRIDPDIVWLIVEDDLPALKSFVERVICESPK